MPNIDPDTVRAHARLLRSEHGENSEYDRALVELTMHVLGATENERPTYERLILGRPRVEFRELHVSLHAVYDTKGHLVAAFVNPATANEFADSLIYDVSTGNEVS